MIPRVVVLGISVCGLLVLSAVGCGKPEPPRGAKGHSHGEWWCDLHGLPEEECSLCSRKVREECKAKGDWCEEHRRAKSHCFFCDPSLKDRFAAKYRAKYGKEPPAIGEMEKKGG
jgi:hypothetical protein